MGDPMAPSEGEGNSEGGGHARRIAGRQAKRAGITRPQLLEMSRPGALGTQEKAPALSWVDRHHADTFERF
jgi:hypothetical protein